MSKSTPLRRRGRTRAALAASAAGLLVGAAMLVGAGPSFAVHDTGQFELDGNVVNSGQATYDWADLFNADGSQKLAPDVENGPLLGSVFTADSATPDASYFATSDKDTDAIADWQCAPKNNPSDKNDLLNAYAALVRIPADAKENAGHEVLYLGSERDTNNGTSYAGFWLLQDRSVGCPDGTFSGKHVDGDLLIVSDYTNGGGTQDVSVYRWTGDDATGQPVKLPAFDGAVCAAQTNDDACAVANADGPITTPWAPTNHDSQTFVEAGIDLTTLLSDSQTCFSTFLAESRSSAELGAQLKDFAQGSFNTCPEPPITTTASGNGALNAPGSTQHDDAVVPTVGDRPAPTGSVAFFLCQPAQVTAEGCPAGAGTQVGDAVTLGEGSATSADASGQTTTALGTYCWRAEYTPDARSENLYLPSTHTNADTECFTVVHADPTISTVISVDGDNANSLGLTTIGDTATLTGFAGPVAGEAVTFDLYGPYVTDEAPDCESPGKPVFSTTATLDASGVASVPRTTFTPTAPGLYYWVASYAGNALNSGATEACNNEAERIVVRAGLVGIVKTADPGGPVPAGDPIGFDIVVSNSGQGVATGVTVTDDLPGGPAGDLDWKLAAAPTESCEITGEVGAQVLTCRLGDVAPGTTLDPVKVVADTRLEDCGTVTNVGTVASTNAGTTSDDAAVEVYCAALTITKTADDDSVLAGKQIGFTIEVTNTSDKDAVDVLLTDPLPAGDGIDWSIDPADEGCEITDLEGAQTLACATDVLAPDETVSVHVVSDTTEQSCALYENQASVDAQNAALVQADAQENVVCPPLVITDDPNPSPSKGVDPQSLPATGAGPVQGELVLAFGLLAAGAAFVAAGRRRRQH